MSDKLTLKQWPMSKTSPETKLTVEGSLIESDGPPSIVFRSSAAPVMTIHPDGKITLSDGADPTEAAAACVEGMSHMIQNQINKATQAERDRIAAWLRRIGKPQLADAIEREEHLA